MAKIGRMNRLKVVNLLDFGAFLDGGLLEDILMPRRFVPEGCQIGDEVEVFVYLDSDGVPIATTQKPKAQIGQFACLKVTDTNRVGAFLDWNVPKELLVPFGEQKVKMEKGQHHVVYVYQEDQNYRIVASSKIHKFLSDKPHRYRNGQPVSLMIWDETDLGYTAIVDNKYVGLLFHKDIENPVRTGMKLDGFIKRVRPDQKLDVCLKKPGFNKVAISDLGETIMKLLDENEGFIPYTDRTDPEIIKTIFGASKRQYKMALGGLYKNRLIRLEQDGVYKA